MSVQKEKINSILETAIDIGVPCYNSGDYQKCYDIYLQSLREAISSLPETDNAMRQRADKVYNTAAKYAQESDYSRGAWELRFYFDEVLQYNLNDPIQNGKNLINFAISKGVPLYNCGDYQGCYRTYMETAVSIVHIFQDNESIAEEIKERFLYSIDLASTQSGAQGAWTLRYLFDEFQQANSNDFFKTPENTSTQEEEKNLIEQVKQLKQQLKRLQVERSLTSAQEDEYPEEFHDPISFDIMEWPTIAMDGYTYERKQIERWFSDHDSSPLTGATLESKLLIPNHNLKSQILSYKERLRSRSMTTVQ